MSQSTDILAELRDRSTDEVVAIYASAEAAEAKIRNLRLLALAVLDERKVHTGTGTVDTTGWLAATSQATRTRAHAEVRAARALIELPKVADAAAEGRISWDQLDNVVQLADAETDAKWAEEAPEWSPAALARYVRSKKVVEREEACRRHRERTFRWWTDHAAGMTRFAGALPDADGAIVVKALERGADKIEKNADGTWEPFDARSADALVELASQQLLADSDPDRSLVVVHTPAASLRDASTTPGSELPELELSLAVDTVRRLACDATSQVVVVADDGRPVGIGRRSRTVPRWLYRLLRQRDHTCRFDGCDRTRGLQAHHIVHWADGGTTDLENLILVCPFHHRFLHEHRWTIHGDPSRPDGVEFRAPADRHRRHRRADARSTSQRGRPSTVEHALEGSVSSRTSSAARSG